MSISIISGDASIAGLAAEDSSTSIDKLNTSDEISVGTSKLPSLTTQDSTLSIESMNALVTDPFQNNTVNGIRHYPR